MELQGGITWNYKVESPSGITSVESGGITWWNHVELPRFHRFHRLRRGCASCTAYSTQKVAMRLVKAAKWIMRLICPKWRHMWTAPAMPPPGGGVSHGAACVATVPAHLRLPHLAVVCCDGKGAPVFVLYRVYGVERILLPTAVGAMYQQCSSSGTVYRQ